MASGSGEEALHASEEKLLTAKARSDDINIHSITTEDLMMASENESTDVVVKRIEKFISGIAEKEGYKEFELKTTHVSTHGANYSSDLYYVDVIENGKETLNLFVKFANMPGNARKKISVNHIFQHEHFVYSKVAPMYHDLQERHGVPEEKRFKFPKYYGANLKEMEEMLVFENLAAQGYELYDRFKPIDWEYAKAAAEEIAKFHALSFALQKEYPDEFDECFIRLPDFMNPEVMLKDFIDASKKKIPSILSIVEAENRLRLETYFKDNEDQLLIAYYKSSPSKYAAKIHSDYRASNIMVKYEGNDVVALKPVDYQIEAYGCPVNDIIYLLLLGSDESFRKQYFEKYLEHYYNSLASHLQLLSQDINEIYPRSAFYFDLKDRMLAGMEVALLAMDIIMIDPKANKTIEDFMDQDNVKLQGKPNKEYVERMNGIVRDFVRWGFLEEGKSGNNASSIPTSASDDLMMGGENATKEVVNRIEKFISGIAEKEGYKEFELNTTLVSTHGANYTSNLYYVDVIEKGKQTLNLFVKFANVPANVREKVPVNQMFQQEKFIYSKVAETYHDLQERHGMPEEKRFKFPKYYGANLEEMEEMLVLENLAAQGYILYDRFKPIDWEYAKAAVEEIAKFHALSFALQKENPDEFDECFVHLKDLMDPEVLYKDFIDACKKKIPFVLSIVEVQNRFRLQKYFKDKYDQLLMSYYNTTASRYTAKIHSDYRASNIMVKYESNDVVALKPVDYQIEAYGCPVNDIIYLLLLGSDESFRKQYFEKYLEHYYNSLASHLQLLSQDINEIYPRSAFYFDLKDRMLAGMEVAIFLLEIVLLEPEANKTIEDLMDPDKVKLQGKPNKEYVERINGIVRDFVRWGFLEEEDKSDTQIEKESISPVNTTADSAPADVHSRLKKFISGIAKKEGFGNFELKTTPMSTYGANYTADLFYVDVVENGKEELNLFVKVANAPAELRKALPIADLYKHEAFVYTTLANMYHDLQEKHSVPDNKRFKFPKYYGANLNEMEEMIAFENLAAQDYILYDRFKSIDWEYAKAAVEEIAKFHALSFALQKENPDAFKKAFDHTPAFFHNEDLMRNMAASSKKETSLILKIVEPENRSRLQKYLEANEDQLGVRYFKSMPSKYSTIIHSDFRASNIMVKFKGSNVVSLKPVDYQVEAYGCPINDLVYFLFIGSDEKFREQYFEKFFEHYYNSMAEHLKLLSQDINEIYPRSAFYFDLKDRLIAGLELGLLGMSVIFIDPEKPKTLEDIMNPEKSISEDNPSEQYVERVNGLVRDMARWGYFDEVDQFDPVQKQLADSNNDGKNASIVDEKTIATRSIETLARSIAEQEGFKNFNLKTRAMSTGGANLLADLFYVDVIEDGRETLNLFVKAANTPEQFRKMFPIGDIYKHETLMYTTLAESYHELQEKHGVPEEKRFKFPKYYGSNLKEMEEMLMLENLSAQNFILYDRFKPVDWEYAKAAVEEIAKFHALSFALQKENPDAFQQISEKLPDFAKGEEILNNFVETTKKGIPLILSVVEAENKTHLQKYIEDKNDQLLVAHFKTISKYSAIIHGDYRASNIMVRYQDRDIVSLKPVDYQGGFIGSPINDILYFIFLGSDEEFRRKYFENYLEHYHNSLAAHLKLLSHDINDIYPRSQFYFELKNKLCYGLEVVLSTLHIVLNDNTVTMTIEDIMDPKKKQPETKPSEQYVERLNGVVRDFVRWGLLGEENILTEVKQNFTTDKEIEKKSTSMVNTAADSAAVDVHSRLKKFISGIAGKEGFENFELKTTPMSTYGANYTADLFYVDVVENGKEELNLFVKVANAPAQVRKMIPIGDLYKHEAFVYTTLANIYHDLQEKHDVPKEKRFQFPKYYGANLNEMEEMIAFENLAAQDYILYDRFKPIDWEYAKAAVEEIAKFHALSFALQKENSEAFEKAFDHTSNFIHNEDMIRNMAASFKKGIPDMLKIVEPVNRSRLEKYLEANDDHLIVRYFKNMSSKYSAILHSDFRASNIMVKYKGNDAVALKPVDYQAEAYGCPVNDLIYFLFIGSDEQFRKQYFEKFFEHYYNSMAEHLKLLLQDINEIYPRSAFYFDLKDRLIGGLEFGLLGMSVLFIDPEKPKTMEDIMNPEKSIAEDNPSEEYVERVNGLVRDMARWGYFDEIDKFDAVQKQAAESNSDGTTVDDDNKKDVVHKIEKFVSSIAKKEGFNTFNLKTTPMSTEGANYLADLFYVDVTEDGKETLHLFIKASNTPAHVRKIFPVGEIYKHEVFMYTTVADTYHEMQEKHGVPEEKRFKFPKYYGANLNDMEELLVLENLSAQGYILFNRFKPVDWEYAKAAVEEIAKFHALSFVLQKENPQLFQAITENIPEAFKDEEALNNFIETSKQGLPLVMSVIEQENKGRVQKYIDDNKDQLLAAHFKQTSKNPAIIHVDYRASNIMVKYQGNDVVSLKPVDYQGGFLGCPINDILYFIFLGSDEEFRRKHFEDYLEHYHNSLSAHLKLLSQDINDIYPKTTFYFELKNKMGYGLEVALFTLKIVLIDPQANMTIEEFIDPDKVKTETTLSKNFVERLNGIVRDFVRWGFFDEENKSQLFQNNNVDCEVNDKEIEKKSTSMVNTAADSAAVDVHSRLKKFISGIAGKEGFENFELKTTPMSTYGANYTADLFYVDVVENGKEELNLFVKVANAPAQVRKMIPIGDLYKHEAFVYTTLANIYHDLQEKHDVPKEKRFQFPKYYGANLNEMEEMIAFENLAAQDYILYDRFKPIDWEYAKAAVEEIAKFHALSFALQKENSEAFEKAFDHTSNFIHNEDMIRNMAASFKKGIPDMLKIVEPVNRSRLEKYLEANDDHLIVRYFKNMSSKYSAILHSDFRASNIMVKYKGNDVVALKPVDYQAEAYGCPVNDLIYFLFIGSDEQFRKQYFEKFFEHYYNSMAEHLKLLLQDINEIYPRSAFYFDLKDRLIGGLEFGLLGMSVLFIDPEKPKTMEDIMNPEKSIAEDNPSEEYVERVNGLVRDMARWGYFDEIDKFDAVQKQAAESNSDGTTVDDDNKKDVVHKIEKFVSSIAKKEGFNTFNLKTTPMSTEGANYLADLFYVDVTEDGKETLHLFIKASNTPAHVRKIFPVGEIYKHEVFMYTTVADTYHEMQEKHGVPEEKRFKFPKYYGANLNDMEELLVLENLSAQGYILFNRFKPVDWEYAKAAVEEIAKFHALSFVLQKENPQLFQAITENIPEAFKDEEALNNFIETSKQGLPLVMSVIEQENKGRVQKYIDDNKDQLLAAHFKQTSKNPAIIHVDYRASNIMVKYQGNDVVSLKPVDYQGGFLGCPINDILYFIFLGSDEEFRRKHFEDYLEHYHNSLSAHLKLLSQDINDIYPKTTFYFELKNKMGYGLEVALFTLKIVLIDPQANMTIEEFIDPDKVKTETTLSKNFVERLNGIVRDFVRWGFFDEENKSQLFQNNNVDCEVNGSDNKSAENSNFADANVAEENEPVDVIQRVETFISSIGKKKGIKNFELKTRLMSTHGANYTADLFYVDLIENGKEVINFFVKAANTPPQVRNFLNMNDAYKRETFIYTTFAETYHKLQEKHGVPEDKQFKFPKFYGSNLKNMEEMLVLENLSAQGYILYDRFKPIDWEYAKNTIEEIAKFHAMSFALQRENRNAFQALVDNLQSFSEIEVVFKNFLETSKKRFPLILSVVDIENRNKLQKYMNNNKNTLMLQYYKPTKNYSTIIHGDFRASNIMVKYLDNKVSGLKPVDYQGPFYGCPIPDLLNFLFLGSDEEFRKKHLEDYFEHYHKSLAAHLKLLSLDINEVYPKSAFYFDLKDRLLFGLDSALLILNIILVDTEDIPTLENLLDSKNAITATSFNEKYTERLNGIVRDFVRWGYLDDEDRPASTEVSHVAVMEQTGDKRSDRGINELVTKIARKEGFNNFRIETKSISTDGANYMGDLYVVDVVEEGKETLKLFAKVTNIPKEARAVIPAAEVYKNEIFMYTTVADAFHELQEKHGIPETERFRFVKYYGSSLKEFEEMIVLENLAEQGYEVYDRFKSLDWEYAKAALKELAKFHALSFALKKENPEMFETVKTTVKNPFKDSMGGTQEQMEQAVKVQLDSTLSIIDDYENKGRFAKYIEDHKSTLIMEHINYQSDYCVIFHGDYRASNILHKYKNNSIVSLKPVDYQTAAFGSPIVDIIYLIFVGTDEEFRRQYLEQCFEFYYNNLAKYLKLMSLDIKYIYPRSSFYFELKDRLPYALDITLFTLRTILVDPKDKIDMGDMVSAEVAMDAFEAMKPSKLFIKRLNGIVRDFVRLGYLNDPPKNEVNAVEGEINRVKEIIRSIADKEGYINFDIKIQPISTAGANYVGELFLADIVENGKKTLKLFSKVSNISEKAREFVPANEMYKNEVYLYTTVADAFHELQERHGVPEEKKFKFLKFYGSNLNDMEEVVVLENLTANGYEVYDRLKPVDWDYAKAAVEEIAKFHALSFALKQEMPESFERMEAGVSNSLMDKLKSHFESTGDSYFAFTESLVAPEYQGRWKKYIHFNKFKFMSRQFDTKPKYRAIIHGDYRTSNILHKYEGKDIVSLKPMNFQTSSCGNPLADILYFLFTGSDEEFRREYFDDFLEHYHNSLATHLKLLSQDINYIFPKSAFYFEIKEMMLFGIDIGLYVLGTVLVDPSKTLKMDDIVNEEMVEDYIAKYGNNKFFQDRLNGIVRDFVRWGYLSEEDKSEDPPAVPVPVSSVRNIKAKEKHASPAKKQQKKKDSNCSIM